MNVARDARPLHDSVTLTDLMIVPLPAALGSASEGPLAFLFSPLPSPIFAGAGFPPLLF
jgi:hypothetical protein